MGVGDLVWHVRLCVGDSFAHVPGLYCLDAGIGASHHSRVTVVSDGSIECLTDHVQLSSVSPSWPICI